MNTTSSDIAFAPGVFSAPVVSNRDSNYNAWNLIPALIKNVKLQLCEALGPVFQVSSGVCQDTCIFHSFSPHPDCKTCAIQGWSF